MYDGIVQELIDELGRLPGIGPKSAQRIAFHIVQTQSFDVTRLSEVLRDVRARTGCEQPPARGNYDSNVRFRVGHHALWRGSLDPIQTVD